jgi:Kef-type K+ transport system membrane component KefB
MHPAASGLSEGRSSMNDMTIRRLTGICGVLVGVGGVLSVPLYFLYSGPPPAWDVLTRNLLTITVCMCLIVFLTGFRHLISLTGPDYDWLARLIHGTGMIYTAVILVGVSLEAGAVIGQPGSKIDPTTDGPLANGDILIHGSIGRALTVVMLTAAGYAILRTDMLPAWIGRTAYVIAAANLACVPSLYFGNNAAQFYSALGWGNTALAASLIAYWTMAVGVVLLSRTRNAATHLPTQVTGRPRQHRGWMASRAGR